MAVIWDGVVGRTELKEKLLAAVKENRLGSTLLFAGATGIGKRRLALGLAQFLVCETGSGCGACGPCRRIEQGSSESLHVLEAEGGTIKLEQVRPLREALSLRNWNGRRVVIIDPADQLNPQSANALLKILEEPPEGTFFFLITAHLSAVMATIRSRSQVVRVMPASAEELGEVELPKWVQELAQGQTTWGQAILQMDQDGLMNQSVGWWLDITRGERVPKEDSWREAVRDKDGALKVLELWGLLLYRARRAASGLALSEAPDAKLVSQWQTKPLVIDRLWMDLLNLKSEIEGQVDRGLALESYWLKAREYLR